MPKRIPSITWFEHEILNVLSKNRRYGQQLIYDLSASLGEDVSSGRLYPILQKLEKNGLIHKESEDRGRFFYTIAPQGKKELIGAMRWSLSSLMQKLTAKLAKDVSVRVSDHLNDYIDQLTSGKDKLTFDKLAVFEFTCKPKGQSLVIPFAKSHVDVTFYCIHHHAGACGEPHGGDSHVYDEYPNITEMAAPFDDLPLKSDFVNAAIMIVTLHETQDRKSYLEEVLRIMKPGGLFILIEFARFESAILEELFSIMHHDDDDGDISLPLAPYVGLSDIELHQLLDGNLENLQVEQIKDLIICIGRKA